MKKWNFGIIVLLAFLFMIGNVNATSVEELIKKQNPIGLTKADKANVKCEYTYSKSNDCTKSIVDDWSYTFTAPFYDPKIKIENSKLSILSKIGGIEASSLNPFSSDTGYKVSIPSESLFLSNNVWYCPEVIYANMTIGKRLKDQGMDNCMNDGSGGRSCGTEIKTTSWDFSLSSSGEHCKLKLQNPENVIFSGKKNNGDSTDDYYATLDKAKEWACGGFVSDRLLAEINKIYKTISLGIVVVVIILGVLDFIKAVSSDDDNALKKAGSKFLKRIVIAMVIVMLPIILQFILTIFGDSNMKECLDKIK